jgi:predicted P-loop ATPase/GTPase
MENIYYYHFTKKEIKEIDNRKYKQSLTYITIPNGFWLSEGLGWKDYYIYDDNIRCFSYQYIVEIDHKKLLKIKSIDDVLKFINKYKIKINKDIWLIDWDDVMSKYTGIYFIYNEKEIERLLDKILTRKFYDYCGWYISNNFKNTNSICIFDTSIIKNIKLECINNYDKLYNKNMKLDIKSEDNNRFIEKYLTEDGNNIDMNYYNKEDEYNKMYKEMWDIDNIYFDN